MFLPFVTEFAEPFESVLDSFNVARSICPADAVRVSATAEVG